MTVLVTGAAGFIGTHIATALTECAHTTITTSRQPPKNGGDFACDLRNSKSLPTAEFRSCRAAIHCAAVLPSASHTNFDENVLMTRNLLKALPSQLACLVLLSSISVYPLELNSTVDTDESCSVFTQTAYGASKRRQEELVVNWGKQTGTRVVILRPSSVFGNTMRRDSLLPQLLQSAVQNTDINLYAPEGYRQNFISVRDVADIAVAAVTGDMQGTYNLFSDDTFTARRLANLVVNVSDSRSRVLEQPARKAAPCIRFTNARLRNTFQPVFRDFPDELAAICDEFRSTQSVGDSA